MNNRKQIVYTENPIDRSSHLRKDVKWINETLASSDTKVLIINQQKTLITFTNDEQTILTQLSSELEVFLDQMVFLGIDNSQAVFGLDLSQYSNGKVSNILDKGESINMRGISSTLKPNEASLLAYAQGLFNWRATYKYCHKCGWALRDLETGHVKVCTNSNCGQSVYPRTDPAVIVLIEHTPKDGGEKSCLLARHHRYKGNMVSTLAGFVEPGESLEHAVQREMKEEVGLDVNNIRYIGSQPWPFPASLMLGFYASSNTLDIQIEEEELDHAEWYTAKQLAELSEAGQLQLSGQDSIARYMITNWIKENYS